MLESSDEMLEKSNNTAKLIEMLEESDKMLEQSDNTAELNEKLEESDRRSEQSNTSDSWGSIFVYGILSKLSQVSAKKRSDDHENRPVIGSKKPQISHEVPKKVVKKKVIMKGQYPQLTLLRSGGNKYTPEAVPDYGDWCDKRQKLHYGQKKAINRPIDFTEKKKVTKRVKSSEEIDQNLVQPGKYQTTDLLEKEINVKSSEESDQNLVQQGKN